MDNLIVKQAVSDIKAGMPISEFDKYYPELNSQKNVFIQYANDIKSGMPDSEASKYYPELFGTENKPQSDININTPKPVEEKGLFRKVGDFFTSSSQKFGETLGKAASVIDPVTNNTREDLMKSRNEQADNFLNLAKNESDPTKKKSYLEAAKESANTTGYDIFSNPEYQKTAKQVYGEALGTVGEMATFSGLSKSVVSGASKAKTVAQVIDSGNKLKKASKLSKVVNVGYESLVNGGLPYGVTKASEAMQENKSGVDIFKEGASGVVQGTALAFGTNVIAKKGAEIINKIKDAKLSKAIEAITPDLKNLSKKDKLVLVKSGNISKQGLLSKAKITNTKEDLRLADKFKDILVKGSNQDKVNNLTQYISEKDHIVGEYLQQNNAIFNNAQLKSQILKRINDNVIDPTLTDKIKEQMVDQLIARIPQNNLEGLWKGRKIFDQYFNKAFTGNPTLKKELTREVRNAAQDFIESKIVDSRYKMFMKDMSDAFSVVDRVSVKAAKDIGQSKVSRIVNSHPVLKKVAKGTAIAGAAYLGGEKLSQMVSSK